MGSTIIGNYYHHTVVYFPVTAHPEGIYFSYATQMSHQLMTLLYLLLINTLF